jgi:crotonobetainyl-CoA:carnitine CoA-transferase CaiB-like acyl-CoA transferase
MVVDLSGVKVVNHPLKHSGVLDVTEWTRPPFRGEHTEMVLSEFAGVREEEIRRMEREGDIEIWREEEV